MYFSAMRLAFVAFLAAAPALAGVPDKGEGTITVLGGIRAMVPGNQAYLSEQGASHQALQPGALSSFGYQFDEELHFKIEIGYMLDRYHMVGGDLAVKSIPILFALDTVLTRGASWSVYGGGGIGYSLNTGTRNGINNEANSTAGYLALGLRYQLTGPMALVVEDRFTLASAQLDPVSTQRLNVGGNFLALGLMFHFFEADDHEHM